MSYKISRALQTSSITHILGSQVGKRPGNCPSLREITGLETRNGPIGYTSVLQLLNYSVDAFHFPKHARIPLDLFAQVQGLFNHFRDKANLAIRANHLDLGSSANSRGRTFFDQAAFMHLFSRRIEGRIAHDEVGSVYSKRLQWHQGAFDAGLSKTDSMLKSVQLNVPRSISQVLLIDFGPTKTPRWSGSPSEERVDAACSHTTIVKISALT